MPTEPAPQASPPGSAGPGVPKDSRHPPGERAVNGAARGDAEPPAGTAGPQQAMTRRTLSLFWSEAARHPVRLAVSLTMPVVTVLAARFVGPWVISLLLTDIQSGTVSWESGWPLVAGYAASQLLGQVVGWRVVLYTTWSFQFRAMGSLFVRVFDHLTAQSLSFHADRFSGSLVSQTNKLTGAFERFWDSVVWEVIPITTTVIAAVTLISVIIPWYAGVLLLLVVGFTVLVVVSARHMEPLNVREAQAANRMTGFLADVTTNIVAVKAAAAEERERAGARALTATWQGAQQRLMRSFLGYSTGYSALMAVINTTAVLAAVLAAEQSVVSVAAVYLATTYTLAVTDQMWEITQVMREYNRVLGDAHDMVAILAVPPAVRDRTDRALPAGPGAVDFDQVGFAHDGSAGPLFRGFSLSIAPGEKIGLVGHSGSGKSTLVRLLLRFSEVDGGAIRIDGNDLREVTQASLRRSLAYVPQEPLLFHRSIAENIAYARPDATPEQIRAAALRANADGFITELPAGYDTMVGERGVKLSGGQRQRVAIARAVLADAAILVLDEATSALDSDSEAQIQSALARAMAGRTTIVIAHRLSTVQAMDRIIVLADGRIVEAGPHRQLLDDGGVYAQMWARQSGAFLT